MRDPITLACDDCKRRNYIKTKNKRLHPDRVEMPKVSWPSRRELRDSTVVVIVMTLILAGIVYVFDKIYVFGLERLFRAG